MTSMLFVNWLTQLSFQHPWMLLLLLLIPAVAFYLLRSRRERYATLRLSTLRGLQGMSGGRGRWRVLLPGFRAVAYMLFVIALARPQLPLQKEEIKAEGIDIMLTMDLSSSMLARDFDPDRLQACKQVAVDFVEKRPYDRIGLSVFAGEAFTRCPLTTDHTVVKQYLRDLECGILKDGTAIGMGLATAINSLRDSDAESKVAILLTDGVNNSGYLKPSTAADIAQQFNIRVYTIGVGSNGDALTPVRRRSDGRYIFGLARVEIDEALLRSIAERTQGRYFRATNESELEDIYDEIDQLEKTEIDVTVVRNYTEEYATFLRLGLLFLLLEVVLRYTVLRTIP